MIKSITKNELKWNLPYLLRKDYEIEDLDQMALELVNSEERKLIFNGFVMVSENKNDLLYIYDLFSNVRIKTTYINTIKLYSIEYATNYKDIMFYGKNEKMRKQFEKRYIRIEDLVLGNKTIEDLQEATNFINTFYQKRSQRAANKRYIDNLVTIKKIAKSKFKEKILAALPSFKDKYGNDVYLQDGVIYSRYQVLSTHKCLQ